MTTVLLTGAGGTAIPGLIEHLCRHGYRVLAADMDPYAIGLYLAEAGFVVYPDEKAKYKNEIIKLSALAEENIFDDAKINEVETVQKISRLNPDLLLSV